LGGRVGIPQRVSGGATARVRIVERVVDRDRVRDAVREGQRRDHSGRVEVVVGRGWRQRLHPEVQVADGRLVILARADHDPVDRAGGHRDGQPVFAIHHQAAIGIFARQGQPLAIEAQAADQRAAGAARVGDQIVSADAEDGDGDVDSLVAAVEVRVGYVDHDHLGLRGRVGVPDRLVAGIGAVAGRIVGRPGGVGHADHVLVVAAGVGARIERGEVGHGLAGVFVVVRRPDDLRHEQIDLARRAGPAIDHDVVGDARLDDGQRAFHRRAVGRQA